ncbi:hypothetical protein Emag_003036 [Eimeria magna]
MRPFKPHEGGLMGGPLMVLERRWTRHPVTTQQPHPSRAAGETLHLITGSKTKLHEAAAETHVSPTELERHWGMHILDLPSQCLASHRGYCLLASWRLSPRRLLAFSVEGLPPART